MSIMNEAAHQTGVLESLPAAAQPHHPDTDAEAHPGTTQPRKSFFARLAGGLPTVLVVIFLGGLAYWGHQAGWTVPKFSELVSGPAEKDDWCKEHGVPESACVECNASLLPRPKSTWCRKHGVHNCPFERPELVQAMGEPDVTAADLERADR